jgi:hypothetical protein
MKVLTIATALLAVLFFAGMVVNSAGADPKGGPDGAKGFVDENNDGVNDNALDADGDGIPNGKDPDYTGAKERKGNPEKGFVDADGDGINDNAQDADGDGIPNGKDPDYAPPKDGSGAKRGNLAKRARTLRRGFIDEDGDGINDLAADSDGDGIPNCQDPDYVPAGKGPSKTRSRGFRLAPAAEPLGDADRIRDRDSDGTCDGTGRKIRRGVRG